MKEMTLEQVPRRASELLEAAQQQRILVTRDGKPFAVVVGLENKHEEDFRLEASAAFWQMLEARRREPTVPLEDIKAELLAGEKSGG